jgi:glycine/D-amino acid oxidase-like deaminating enzyme
MSRQVLLGGPWDLVVIGGGITGAGILLEAARRGLRCCWWSSAILRGVRRAGLQSWCMVACGI